MDSLGHLNGYLLPGSAHAAVDDRLWVMFNLDPGDAAEVAQVRDLNDRLVARALAMDGTCTGEHGMGLEKMGKLVDELGLDAVDQRWPVSFSQLEPDLGRFVDRFAEKRDRHPVTGGFGRWLNLLGQWDWWDVGGCFDGRITGGQKPSAQSVSAISSGQNAVRTVLENLQSTLSRSPVQDAPAQLDVETGANFELVAKLLIDARAHRPHALPGVVMLPSGFCDDSERWLASPPEAIPVGVRSLLKLADDADWPQVAEAAYECFKDHWAAGVAFHY